MTLRSFAQWKARSLAYLISLRDKAPPEIQPSFNLLIYRLQDLRVAWLSGWLRDLYLVSQGLPDVLKTLPTPEEIEAWMGQGSENL